MKKKSLLVVGVLALSTLALGTGCREDLIADGTFRNWCGDTLCNWESNGKIEKAATWSEADTGVSIVEGSIRTRLISGADCIEFSTMAKIEDGADLQLQLDLNDDGRVDFVYPFPSVDWREVKVTIRTPSARAGTRLIIQKGGYSGLVAILGSMRLKSSDACTGTSAKATVDGKDLRTNDRCATDGECGSGVCCQGRCSDCCPKTSAACKDGRACAQATGAEPRKAFLCAAPGAGKAGDACIDKTDCASGICRPVREIYTCAAPSPSLNDSVGSDVECKWYGDLCPRSLVGTSQCERVDILGGQCVGP